MLKNRIYNQGASLLLLIAGILVTALVLRQYLAGQWFNIVLGGLALLFVFDNKHQSGRPFRFLFAALFFILISFFVPVHTLLYFSLICILMYLYELYYARVNWLMVAIAVFISPIFSYVIHTFSFPIRLWITQLTGKVFQLAGLPVHVAGNTISYAGGDFTVDPACMGLSMLTASLLIGLLIAGFYMKKYHQEIPFRYLLLLLLLVFLLNIASNLIRIFILVLFHILPDTAMHELVGILCLIVQVVLPVWGICWWCASHHYFPVMQQSESRQKTVGVHSGFLRQVFLPLVVCILFSSSAIHIYKTANHQTGSKTFSINQVSNSYEVVSFSSEVVKLENSSVLIYVKRIRWFFDTEHNPMICWVGSGYQMSQTKEIMVGDKTLYTGTLYNETDTLNTAWWYGNGLSITNSQFQWRMDMLKGKPAYALVNVTVSSPEKLEMEIMKAQKEITFN